MSFGIITIQRYVNGYAINLLGMTQIRPLLLAILEKFHADNVRKSFEKLVAVAVRFQIVGGAGGGSLEKFMAKLLNQLASQN